MEVAVVTATVGFLLLPLPLYRRNLPLTLNFLQQPLPTLHHHLLLTHLIIFQPIKHLPIILHIVTIAIVTAVIIITQLYPLR